VKFYREYMGMSYEQASREAERLINLHGWFAAWERLAELRTIMQMHMQNGNAAVVDELEVQ
jgi:hypothetical protein